MKYDNIRYFESSNSRGDPLLGGWRSITYSTIREELRESRPSSVIDDYVSVLRLNMTKLVVELQARRVFQKQLIRPEMQSIYASMHRLGKELCRRNQSVASFT